jgi:LemA protein
VAMMRKSESQITNPKFEKQSAVGIWNLGFGIRDLLVLALVISGASMASGCSYNTFVSKEESIKAQWAQVENQLQRRNDLIPNLVETTKGIAQQEKDVFGQIAESRAKMAGARTPEETIQAANQQSTALGRLLVVAENYPQLRSSESFNRLMDELSGTENRIAVERMRYNERVQDYNTSRRQFPSNVTASLFGFKEYPLFNAPPAAEQVPKVNFGKGTD